MIKSYSSEIKIKLKSNGQWHGPKADKYFMTVKKAITSPC